VSKAFTRESDDSGSDELPITRPPLPPGTRNYITRSGANQLQQRLTELLERKQLLASESNETTAASEAEKRKLELVIRNVQQTLDTVVVAEIPADKEKIAFGATVTLRHAKGDTETYRIVGVEELDLDRNWISWASPLARALLSKKAGDKVRFRSPGGEDELEILEVSFSAE